MLYWCKREIKFGGYWLLKTHIVGAAGRTDMWGADDRLVLMVRAFEGSKLETENQLHLGTT
jgi:hypothetical protein